MIEHRKVMRIGFYVFGLALLSVLLGCPDPERMVNQYFQKSGLNRLATVRDDIQPGALILKKNSFAIYNDSVFDYSKNVSASPGSKDIDLTKDFEAVLQQHKADKRVDASVALDFVKAILPVSIEADLGLTGNVTIELINAKGTRIKPKDLQKAIKNDGGGLKEHIDEQPSKPDAFVVYETYKTNALKIVAASGTDVSTKVGISDVLKPLSSANGNFKYKRSAKETLVIQGDKDYVFAVRTAHLVWQNGAYILDVTDFIRGADVKAIGGEEKYSAPIQGKFEPVKLTRVPKGQIVSFPD